jgi:hypothetical protein
MSEERIARLERAVRELARALNADPGPLHIDYEKVVEAALEDPTTTAARGESV